MTVTIEASGELEAALKAQAREQGLTADLVARRVLTKAPTPGVEADDVSAATRTGGKQKARAFTRWARIHH
jgi:hypothetical protein